MMDKEILDEIETSWMNEGHLVKIDREHFDWLIKQIKILQQEKDEWFKKYKQADATTLMQYKQLEKANAEIQRLNDICGEVNKENIMLSFKFKRKMGLLLVTVNLTMRQRQSVLLR